MIKWRRCDGKIDQENFKRIFEEITFILPKLYLESIKTCDRGVPFNKNFQYYDEYFNRNVESRIGEFISINDLKFLEIYNEPAEYFPESLVAFVEVGNGNFVCFDYRGNKKTNPPIVYWNHEASIGKDVSFIADDFEAFLNMLKEPNAII